jgi:diguanylate cyclase (GGDEF)-like protein
VIGYLALKDRDGRWFAFTATAQSRRISFTPGNGAAGIPPALLGKPFSGMTDVTLEQRSHLLMSERDPYTGATFMFLSPPLGEGFTRQFLQRNSMQLGLSLALLLALVCIEQFLQRSIRISVRLHHIATRDPLTGVLNRRAIMQQGALEEARAKRSGSAFALLQIDIDHFKRINDTHGHPCSDAALKFFTGLLHSTARQQDQVARIGGEEFLVLLPETGLAGAQQLATRLLEQLKATPCKFQQLEIPMTCSLGVTAWRGATDSFEDMLVRGDRLLYQAKHNGRARYESQAAD